MDSALNRVFTGGVTKIEVPLGYANSHLNGRPTLLNPSLEDS